MKERLVLAVSWWAFVHAAIIGFGLILEPLGVRSDSLGGLEDFLKGYVRMFPFLEWETFAFGFSPAVWVVLWILTGSPRILPWR